MDRKITEAIFAPAYHSRCWHKPHRPPLLAGAFCYLSVWIGRAMVSTILFDAALIAVGVFNAVLVTLLILSY